MAVDPVEFTPIVDLLADVEASAALVVLAAAELVPPPGGELAAAVTGLAGALWALQQTRARVRALAAEVGTPPLHVVEL